MRGAYCWCSSTTSKCFRRFCIDAIRNAISWLLGPCSFQSQQHQLVRWTGTISTWVATLLSFPGWLARLLADESFLSCAALLHPCEWVGCFPCTLQGLWFLGPFPMRYNKTILHSAGKESFSNDFRPGCFAPSVWNWSNAIAVYDLGNDKAGCEIIGNCCIEMGFAGYNKGIAFRRPLFAMKGVIEKTGGTSWQLAVFQHFSGQRRLLQAIFVAPRTCTHIFVWNGLWRPYDGYLSCFDIPCCAMQCSTYASSPYTLCRKQRNQSNEVQEATNEDETELQALHKAWRSPCTIRHILCEERVYSNTQIWIVCSDKTHMHIFRCESPSSITVFFPFRSMVLGHWSLQLNNKIR